MPKKKRPLLSSAQRAELLSLLRKAVSFEHRFGLRVDCQESVNAAWLAVVDYLAQVIDG
jgi:hypothetical protein